MDNNILTNNISANISADAAVVLKDMKQIFGKRAVLPALSKRYTKEQIQEEIEKDYGIVTIICNKLDCTAKQLYNALDEYKLRDYLAQCKQQLVGIAEKAILECMQSSNESIKLKAAETTLKSLGRDTWNESPSTVIQQQINVSDEKLAIKEIFGIKE